VKEKTIVNEPGTRLQGATYAHPETDGASYWEMEGPANLPGAPPLDSPAVLPMRPDEPGEPLIVSGTVRSTTGEPLPGAVLDLRQIDANNIYSGMKGDDFGMLGIKPGVTNDATGIPPTTSGPRSSPTATGTTSSARSCPAPNPPASSPAAR
jgi:hypothetical protein